MTDETALEIFEACYRLFRTMHDDPPPSMELNFAAGMVMGGINRALKNCKDAGGPVHGLFPDKE